MDLQEILIEEWPALKPNFIKNSNPVVSYIDNSPGAGVTINLADGTTADMNVLFGSNGIWSVVQAQMHGEEIKKSSEDLMTR